MSEYTQFYIIYSSGKKKLRFVFAERSLHNTLRCIYTDYNRNYIKCAYFQEKVRLIIVPEISVAKVQGVKSKNSDGLLLIQAPTISVPFTMKSQSTYN